MKVSLEEVELLAGLLARAGVNRYEALWANNVLDKLRQIVLESAPKPPTPSPDEPLGESG